MCFFVVFLLVFQKSSSFCRENEIFENKKKQKKNDHFLTLKRANIGPLFNFTAYIYMHMLWCYYLAQVWPFEVLLSGPSLFFTKHCLSKNTIKIGVSALFFWKKNCARKFEVLLSGPSWPFLSCSQLGPDNNTYLAQIITPQNAFFFFFAFKNLLKYLFL